MNNGIDKENLGANQSIVVVSTDRAKRDRIIHHLHAAGFSVLEAAGGAEALDLARKFEQEIDVFFVDDRSSDINAPALAAVIEGMRPAARVLLSSQMDDKSEFPAPLLIEALQRALGNHDA